MTNRLWNAAYYALVGYLLYTYWQDVAVYWGRQRARIAEKAYLHGYHDGYCDGAVAHQHDPAQCWRLMMNQKTTQASYPPFPLSTRDRHELAGRRERSYARLLTSPLTLHSTLRLVEHYAPGSIYTAYGLVPPPRPLRVPRV